MLPPDHDSPMDFLHPPTHEDSDALFSAYLHPPMVLPDDSPKVMLGSLHPPMLPHDWNAAANNANVGNNGGAENNNNNEFYDSNGVAMQTY